MAPQRSAIHSILLEERHSAHAELDEGVCFARHQAFAFNPLLQEDLGEVTRSEITVVYCRRISGQKNTTNMYNGPSSNLSAPLTDSGSA